MWQAGKFKSGGYGAIWHPVKKKVLRAHCVVFELHHGRAPKKLVLHRCGNAACVRPSHLYEGTHKDNYLDAIQHGTFKAIPKRTGAAHHNSKLTKPKVIAARLAFRRGAPLRQLALRYKVSTTTIHAAIVGKTWAHVPNAVPRGVGKGNMLRRANRHSATGVRGVHLTKKGRKPFVVSIGGQEIGRYMTLREARTVVDELRHAEEKGK